VRTASWRWRCGCSKYRPRAGISQSGTIFAGMMPASTSSSSWGAGQSLALGVRALFFLVNVTTAHLRQIAAMIDAGDLAVNVGTVMPLADARVAHEMLEGLRSKGCGKIVLSVSE